MKATDLPIAIPLLVKNCENNLSDFVNNLEVSTLDVTSPPDFADPVDVVIGADIIYDYPITDGIIDTLKKLIRGNSTKSITILFSVEKRYIFTIKTLDTVAPAFDYFETKLEDLKSDLLDNLNIGLDIQRVNLILCITLKILATSILIEYLQLCTIVSSWPFRIPTIRRTMTSQSADRQSADMYSFN